MSILSYDFRPNSCSLCKDGRNERECVTWSGLQGFTCIIYTELEENMQAYTSECSFKGSSEEIKRARAFQAWDGVSTAGEVRTHNLRNWSLQTEMPEGEQMSDSFTPQTAGLLLSHSQEVSN